MTTESTEEYLEAIYRLTEKGEKITTTNISKLLNVSPASVTEMLQRLNKEGYIKHEPYSTISLTNKGKLLGEKIVRRHRILEKFLDIIGLSRKTLHGEACKLEHAISDDVEKAIDRSIGYPKKSPTGMEIPRSKNVEVIPLINLKSGEKGRIIKINAGKKATMRLMDMGLTLNTKITVINSHLNCPIEISVRGSKLSIGRGLASKIFVEKE
ncbi:MAG: metal-dependent transcriptional regulator [Candidatus Altiarchaeota archaeon]